MTGPDPAVAAVRLAVRRCLGEVSAEASRQELSAEASGQEAPAEASGQEAPGAVRPLVLVACSGGADSLALAAAVAREAPALRLRAGAVMVDHGLQPGSGEVAARAATQCGDLGLDPVLVQRVRVELGPDGPEASARRARYAALEQVAGERGAAAVLLGHTRDDQAEQVLLGLARGSGARSLSGMPRRRGLLHRPLLGVERDMTERACEAEGLQPWHDPQNQDRTYRRVRARRLLALLEQELGPGVKASLARSADLLRQDSDALEAMAHDALLRLAGSSPAAGLPVAPLLALPVAPLLDLPIAPLLELPDAVRTRVWRAAAIAAGSPAGSVSAAHVQAVDALVRDWHGQGPVALPGGVRARRCGDRVLFEPAGPVE